MLKLSVLNRDKLAAELASQIVFDERGGSIGRSPLNKWAINDQQNFISSKHASIFFRDGKYYLTDTSTNGVYINKSTSPLGPNNSVTLKSGDRITIGELDIAVEISANVSVAQPANPTPAASSNNLLSEFGIGDAFENRKNENSNALNDLVNVSSEKAPLFDNDDILDPLALLGVSSPPKKSFATLDTSDNSSKNEIPLSLNPATPADLPMDFAKPLIPQSANQNSGFIPDDFDFFSNEHESPSTQTKAPAQYAQAQEIPEVIHEEPVAVNSAPVASDVHVKTAANASEVIDTILEAANIDKKMLGNKIGELSPQLIGEMLRVVMDGLVTTLIARSQIKSGMRVSVTMIGRRENNPLKFSVTGEEALQNLLQQRPGYMKPVQAIEKAFEDIQSHQLAVMAAMQSTIIALLDRFDPQKLALEFDKLKSAGVFSGKKAHYWEQYELYFEKLKSQLHDDFQSVLGTTFADAYQRQMSKLSTPY